ncbi:hypothetical protein Taro_052418 [Colocasia esculenta]|uniref:Condensin-2 complex subunit H2 n=1 Tax=Colocasia esculenta TaxID=4460 RepID=A0A843XIJ4_COLES|nr:hypothetical protein [Colocasia esculenta]
MSGEEGWAPGEAGSAGGSGGRVHILQPNRDLELNWTVDLAKSLEEYLLKICSGEIDGDGMEQGHLSVNFAEAAMLLQGSVQVYSRKVEYLYTLVLHALEFISQKRHEQQDGSSAQPDRAEEDNTFFNDNEKFLGLDDVSVETKTCLDDEHNEDDDLKLFVKPPANLLVLEGDCLNTNVEESELESYLLSTCNFYGDFLLLDPCDAEAVCNFLRGKDNVKECSAAVRGSLLRSNTRSSFCSPLVGKSGGKGHKLTPGKKQDVNLNCSLENNFTTDAGDKNAFTRPHVDHDSAENDICHGNEADAGYPGNEGCTDDGDDDDDPWKPLNPHEPGNLRIKPFKKGNIFRQKVTSFTRHDAFALQFPLAKLEGTINPEFTDILANQLHACASLRSSESPPLFEKLRQSLIFGNHEAYGGLGDFEDEGNDAEGDSDLPDFEQGDINLPKDTIDMDIEVPLHHKKGDHSGQTNDGEACGKDDMDPQRSLEDLCRLHLVIIGTFLSYVEVVRGAARANNLLLVNTACANVGDFPTESLASGQAWLLRSLCVSSVQGTVEVDFRRWVEALMGGSWEVSMVTPNSFLVLGRNEQRVAGWRKQEFWWWETPFFAQNLGLKAPAPSLVRVVLEGVPLLCDEEGIAFLIQPFGGVIHGKSDFIPIGLQTTISSTVSLASAVLAAVTSVVGGEVFVIRKRWLVALVREAKKDKSQKNVRVEAEEV